MLREALSSLNKMGSFGKIAQLLAIAAATLARPFACCHSGRLPGGTSSTV